MNKRSQTEQPATPTTPFKRHKAKAVEKVDYGPFHNGQTTDQRTIDLLIRCRHVAKHFNPSAPNQFIQDIPKLLWIEDILKPYLRLPDLSILRRSCKEFDRYWKAMLENNKRPIYVPEDRPTLDSALALAKLFASRTDYSREKTVNIQLGEGEFVSTGSMHVLCSNITIMGRGADKTVVVGRLNIFDKKNVFLKQMCITSPHRHGVLMGGSETNVEVVECVVEKSDGDGIYVTDGASLVATRCEFKENNCGIDVRSDSKAILTDCTIHHNRQIGLLVCINSVVDLHGKATDIHANSRYGIGAGYCGTIQIHLPSQHNTSHDNGDQDRKHAENGTITNVHDEQQNTCE